MRWHKSDRTDPRQREIYARMPPEKKIALAMGMLDSWRELKQAWLTSAHPDWTDDAVNRAIRDSLLYARD
ncbi:MAG: hypothetical protein HYY84_16395 [Deltaproteobacteria bacterium]|nr:hypothetical protein [Deltaproteobacteria bacterium]